MIPGTVELGRVDNISFYGIFLCYMYTVSLESSLKKVSRLLTLFPDFSFSHSRDDGMQHTRTQLRPQKAIKRANEY